MGLYHSFCGLCRSITSYDYGTIYNGVAKAARYSQDTARNTKQGFQNAAAHIKSYGHKNPVSSFADNALRASAKLKSSRAEAVIGRVTLGGDDRFRGDDGIFSGMISALQGVRRITFNHKYGTFNNVFAKVAEDVEGKRNDAEKTYMTESTKRRAYRGASYYAPHVNLDNPVVPTKVSDKLRDEWHQYCREISERSRKHFTLFRAEAGHITHDIRDIFKDTIDPETHTEIFTNGRFFYALDENEGGTYDVKHYAPARRKDDEFVPVRLNRSCGFDKVAKNIAEGMSYAEAQHHVAEHWENLSHRLWEEENVPSIKDGQQFYAEYAAKRIVNWPRDAPWDFAASMSFGVTTGLATNSLAFGTIAGAVSHAVHDDIFKKRGQRIARRIKKHFKRPDQYGEDDSSDFFKAGAIGKTASKMNDKVVPQDEQILDFKQSNFPSQTPLDNSMQPLKIRGLIASIDERGFSSIADMIETSGDETDMGTRINRYQNGLVVMKTRCEEGKEIFFATYRADLVLSDGSDDPKKDRRLPAHYREKIEGKILRVEYNPLDPEKNNGSMEFSSAFSVHKVTHDKMMEEVTGSLLYQDKPYMDDESKENGYALIRDLIIPVSESNGKYMRGDIKRNAVDVQDIDPNYIKEMTSENDAPVGNNVDVA